MSYKRADLRLIDNILRQNGYIFFLRFLILARLSPIRTASLLQSVRYYVHGVQAVRIVDSIINERSKGHFYFDSNNTTPVVNGLRNPS